MGLEEELLTPSELRYVMEDMYVTYNTLLIYEIPVIVNCFEITGVDSFSSTCPVLLKYYFARI